MKMSRSVMGRPASRGCCRSVRNPPADRANYFRIEEGLRSVDVAAEGSQQPGASIGPEEISVSRRHGKCGRGFGNGQAGEVAKFDQLRRLGISFGQSDESSVD